MQGQFMHKILWVCAGLMECNAMQLCKEESQLNRISDNIRMAYQRTPYIIHPFTSLEKLHLLDASIGVMDSPIFLLEMM